MLIEDFKDLGIAFSAKSIGQALRAARLAARISFRDLAKASGISTTQILRMEEGTSEYALTRFIRLCVSLGLPPADVLEDSLAASSTKPVLDLAGDSDVIEATQAANLSGEETSKALENIGLFAGLLYQVVIRTLVSARPSFDRNPASCPSEYCREALQKFGDNVAGCSSAERLEMARSLKAHPLDKLKALGLFVRPAIDDAITFGNMPLPGLRGSRTLVRTTVAALLGGEADRRSMAKLGVQTHGLPAAAEAAKARVDKVSNALNMLPVPETLEWIIDQVKLKSAARGTKSAIARNLHVAPQQINDWLTGRSKPSAEKALILLAWVKGEIEILNERAASAVTPATQTRKGKNQTNEQIPSEPTAANHQQRKKASPR